MNAIRWNWAVVYSSGPNIEFEKMKKQYNIKLLNLRGLYEVRLIQIYLTRVGGGPRASLRSAQEPTGFLHATCSGSVL